MTWPPYKVTKKGKMEILGKILKGVIRFSFWFLIGVTISQLLKGL
jgi:hypothetical protein